MAVVSDTTPLNYLILIRCQDVLPALFGLVHVPPAVLAEMEHPKAPVAVRRWAESPPAWAVIRSPAQLDATLPVKLHQGETPAISLALELRARWVLIDDWDARQAALARHLPLSGIWNVLEEAACRGLIDVETAANDLRRTNFRATESQFQTLLENVLSRKLVLEREPKRDPPRDPATP